MTSYAVPPTVRGCRTIPWLRLAVTVLGVAIFVEFAAGVVGGISFENDSLAKWNSYLAAPLKTAALVASPGWWLAVYWVRAGSARPRYAVAALAITSGLVCGGYLDRQLRADQKPALTGALASLQLGADFSPGPVSYRQGDGIDVPTATREWTYAGDVASRCHEAARSVQAWSGRRPTVFASDSSSGPFPVCSIGSYYRGRPVIFSTASTGTSSRWTLTAKITPT